MKIGFFGTTEYSVMTLNQLIGAGYEIAFVVTNPDRPKGRGLIMTPSPVKIFAEKNNIEVIQPENLKNDPELLEKLRSYRCDVFVTIAYGKIIPKDILDIPKSGSLNIHTSLLPALRGSCPIETAILEDERETGVTIIKMDEQMDHGPIVAQKSFIYAPWPPTAKELGTKLVETGNDLLLDTIDDWVAGKIKPKEQDHTKATFTKKIVKEDGLVEFRDLENEDSEKSYSIFRKFQAYREWPGLYFFIEKREEHRNIRIKITQMSFLNRKIIIEKVLPEGEKEIEYKNFLERFVSV